MPKWCKLDKAEFVSKFSHVKNAFIEHSTNFSIIDTKTDREQVHILDVSSRHS